jgi:predicted  nucleic acid-binding Zn-ribbon protein
MGKTDGIKLHNKFKKEKAEKEFSKKVEEIYGDKYKVIGLYENTKTKIEILCSFHGVFFKEPDKLLRRNQGCPECNLERKEESKKVLHEEYINKVKLKSSGSIEVLGVYQNQRCAIEVKCNNCEYTWNPKAERLIQKNPTGCPNCLKENRKGVVNISNVKKREEAKSNFINEIKINFPNYTIIGDYKSCKTKLHMCCKQHGHFFKSPENILRRNQGCPECGKKRISESRSKTHEEFINNLKEKNNSYYEFEFLSKYQGYKKKIKTKHMTCGHIWETSAASLLIGSGCPKCNSSKGEKEIVKVLDKHNQPFSEQHIFHDCRDKYPLKFDVKITKLKKDIIIEFDGEQHFREVETWGGKSNLQRVQKRDQIKNQYCIDNNIPLIRIPYWEFNNIEYILNNVLQHYGLIKKDNTYNNSWKKYLVDKNWNHDSYLALHK